MTFAVKGMVYSGPEMSANAAKKRNIIPPNNVTEDNERKWGKLADLVLMMIRPLVVAIQFKLTGFH